MRGEKPIKFSQGQQYRDGGQGGGGGGGGGGGSELPSSHTLYSRFLPLHYGFVSLFFSIIATILCNVAQKMSFLSRFPTHLGNPASRPVISRRLPTPLPPRLPPPRPPPPPCPPPQYKKCMKKRYFLSTPINVPYAFDLSLL